MSTSQEPLYPTDELRDSHESLMTHEIPIDTVVLTELDQPQCTAVGTLATLALVEAEGSESGGAGFVGVSDAPRQGMTAAPGFTRAQRRDSGRSAAPRDSVRQYLHELGRYPLMTPQEEVQLALVIRDGVAASLRLEGGLVDNSADQEEDVRQVQRGAAAKEEFIQRNLRLVVSVAKRYRRTGATAELLELIQEGNLGLDHAINKFDPDKGFRFSTYATKWIRQYMRRGMSRAEDTIRIPDDTLRDHLHQYLATRDESDAWLEEEFGWSPSYLTKIKRYAHTYRVLSSDAVSNDGSATLSDTFSDPGDEGEYEGVDSILVGYELRRTLEQVLTDREMSCMRMWIEAVGKSDESPYRTIAPALGLSTDATRRLFSRIVEKLRSPEYVELLDQYRILLEE